MVLLLSGGVESTCLAWWLRPSMTITVDYGQVTASAEVDTSRRISDYIGAEHHVLRAREEFIEKGLLVGSESAFSQQHPEFWLFRNQFIVTCALMYIYPEQYVDVAIGTVLSDSKFGDGTKEFLDAINTLVSIQADNVKLIAPAAHLTSHQLVAHVGLPRQLAGLTFSCHTSPLPCGDCPGCRKNRDILADYYDSR